MPRSRSGSPQTSREDASKARSRSPKPRDIERDKPRREGKSKAGRSGAGGGFKWKEKRKETDETQGGEKRLERGYRKRSPSPRRDRGKPGNSVEDKFGVADKFGLADKVDSGKKDNDNTEKAPARALAIAAAPPARNEEPTIIVYVNDRLGTRAPIACLASDTIKDFKMLVAWKIGREPHEILLKRQGERPFKDQLTLEDYGVSNGVQLDLEVDTGD